MKNIHSPLFTVLWDVAQAETQLTLLTAQYDRLRLQLPDQLLTQTTLLSDGLHAVRHRLTTIKHSLTAHVRQEK